MELDLLPVSESGCPFAGVQKKEPEALKSCRRRRLKPGPWIVWTVGGVCSWLCACWSSIKCRDGKSYLQHTICIHVAEYERRSLRECFFD